MTLVMLRFNAWPLTESHHPDHAMAADNRASDDTLTMVSYTGSHGSYMGLARVAMHTEQLGDGLVYDGHRQYGLHAPAALRTPHRTRNADINPTLRLLTSSRPYVHTCAINTEHRDTYEECVGPHARIGTRRTV